MPGVHLSLISFSLGHLGKDFTSYPPTHPGGTVRRIFNPGVSAALSCAEGVKGEDISGKAFLEIGALLFVFLSLCQNFTAPRSYDSLRFSQVKRRNVGDL